MARRTSHPSSNRSPATKCASPSFPATSPVSVLPPGGDRTLQWADGGLHRADEFAVAVEDDQRPVAVVARGVAQQFPLLGPVAEVDGLEAGAVLGADDRARPDGRVVHGLERDGARLAAAGAAVGPGDELAHRVDARVLVG